MSRVTLVTVPLATLGDLLLWHWSLAGNHDVLALVSGLTLFPLLIASVWLLAVALIRVVARGARGPLARIARGRFARLTPVGGELNTVASASPQTRAAQVGTRPAGPAGRDASSRKLAA